MGHQGAHSALAMATPAGFSECVFYPVDFSTTTVQGSSGKFTRECRRNEWGGCLAFLLEDRRASSRPGSTSGSELHATLCKTEISSMRVGSILPRTLHKIVKEETDWVWDRIHTRSFWTKYCQVWKAPNTSFTLFKMKAHQQEEKIKHNAMPNSKIN